MESHIVKRNVDALQLVTLREWHRIADEVCGSRDVARTSDCWIAGRRSSRRCRADSEWRLIRFRLQARGGGLLRDQQRYAR